MHCNLNTKLFYISSVLISKVKAMAHIIRSPHRLDDLNEDDESQYLNNTGEGDEQIFDLDHRADEVMNYDYDDTDNVCDDTDNADLQITKTSGEVYLYKHASW